MSIDRVSTAAQTAFFLSQIQNAGSALDKVQEQIASTKNANTYAGFGDKAQVLTASIAAKARNDAYTNATKFAVTQTDLQDTQLTSLSSLSASLKKAVSDAVANNNATTLMTQAQSIFEQASAILNSKDANGDYIYSGGKTDVPPVSVGSLAGLLPLASASQAFANGDLAFVFPSGHYRACWYTVDPARLDLAAVGIHGQWIYIDPTTDTVIVKVASQPNPMDIPIDHRWLAAFRGIGEALSKSFI
jgi:CubicO group peptidase (beta-lactamase class C family)